MELKIIKKKDIEIIYLLYILAIFIYIEKM